MYCKAFMAKLNLSVHMNSLSMLLHSSNSRDEDKPCAAHGVPASAVDAHSEFSGDDGKDVMSYMQSFSQRYFSDHS